MDPLSVTASVIALIQAAQAVYNGVKNIRDAPKEYLEIKAEFQELIKVLTHVRRFVEVIESSKIQEERGTEKDEQHHGLLRADELDGLKTTVKDLKRAVGDIGKIVVSSTDSKGKLNRFSWLRKDGTASKDLRQEVRRQQATLVLYLTTLPSLQL